MEDRLQAAPKKAKKISFTDPYIYHAIGSWLHPSPHYFNEKIQNIFQDKAMVGGLVEAIVTNHFRRIYPTYYIKAKGEVDIAYIHDNKFWPIEIKWGTQLRPKDLQQVAKYNNGIILTKMKTPTEINGIETQPLPQNLKFLSNQPEAPSF